MTELRYVLICQVQEKKNMFLKMLFQKLGKAQHNENGLVKGLYFIIFRCYLDMLLFRDVVPEFNKYNFNSDYFQI